MYTIYDYWFYDIIICTPIRKGNTVYLLYVFDSETLRSSNRVVETRWRNVSRLSISATVFGEMFLNGIRIRVGTDAVIPGGSRWQRRFLQDDVRFSDFSLGQRSRKLGSDRVWRSVRFPDAFSTARLHSTYAADRTGTAPVFLGPPVRNPRFFDRSRVPVRLVRFGRDALSHKRTQNDVLKHRYVPSYLLSLSVYRRPSRAVRSAYGVGRSSDRSFSKSMFFFFRRRREDRRVVERRMCFGQKPFSK